MALITRISRLFTADLHAVLDRLEEPEILLQQALREMQAAQIQDQQLLQTFRQRQCRLSQQHTQLQQHLQALESALEPCFAAADHALAKTIIRRKLLAEQQIQALQQMQQQLEEDRKTLSQRLDAQGLQIEGLQQQVDLQAAQALHLNAPQPGLPGSSEGVDESAVQVAFLRELQRRESA